MSFRFYELEYRYSKLRDRVIRAIVWKLPKRFIMWSYIRVVAHATTGEYGDTVVPELTAMDALDRWPLK